MTKPPKSLWYNFLLSFGTFFFRHRNNLFPTTFILLFTFSRPQPFFGNYAWDHWWMLFGALVAVAGQCFRLAVIGYAYIKRGGKDGKVYADDLVIRGFYAHCRNPMYFGNMLIVIGLSLMYNSPATYLIVIPLFSLVYLSIVIAEENYLRQKFGRQYEEYERKVSRFIPNWKGLQKSLSEFKYDWKKALRKDYGNVFVVIFFINVVWAWKNYVAWGPSAVYSGIAAIACLTVFYFIIRILKKKGQLA